MISSGAWKNVGEGVSASGNCLPLKGFQTGGPISAWGRLTVWMSNRTHSGLVRSKFRLPWIWLRARTMGSSDRPTIWKDMLRVCVFFVWVVLTTAPLGITLLHFERLREDQAHDRVTLSSGCVLCKCYDKIPHEGDLPTL